MDQIKKSVSQPRTGINKSVDVRNLKENDTTHLLNVNLENVDGDYIDVAYEKSNVLSVEFPEGYKVIGRVNRLKNNFTYYFLTNPTTKKSIFGYVDNNIVFDDTHLSDTVEQSELCFEDSVLPKPLEYQNQVAYNKFNILIEDSCTDDGFNFNINFPIHNPLIKEEKTGAEIYFTDFLNPSRFIKLDDIQYYFTEEVPCDDDVQTLCPNFNKMRIHQLYRLPKIEDIKVSQGGILTKGSYTFVVALSDALGNEVSEYSSITQPISIWEMEEGTDRAIKLVVGDLDPNYNHYKIVALTPSPVEVGVFPTTMKEATISDLSQSPRTSIEKISFINTRVEKVKGLTSIQNSLAEYGIKFEEELNLQPVVNLMGSFLNWQTHVATEDLYSFGEMRSKYTGINRNEVVPYAIRFLLGGGATTALFPLVAREATSFDKQAISVNNLDRKSFENPTVCDQGTRTERWQFYNTATVTGGCNDEISEVEVFDEFVKNCTNFNVGSTGSGSLDFTMEESFYGLQDYLDIHLEDCTGKLPTTNVCEVFQRDYNASCAVDFDDNCGTPEKLSETNFISEIVGERVVPIFGGGTDFVNEVSDFETTIPVSSIIYASGESYNTNGVVFHNRSGAIVRPFNGSLPSKAFEMSAGPNSERGRTAPSSKVITNERVLYNSDPKTEIYNRPEGGTYTVSYTELALHPQFYKKKISEPTAINLLLDTRPDRNNEGGPITAPDEFIKYNGMRLTICRDIAIDTNPQTRFATFLTNELEGKKLILTPEDDKLYIRVLNLDGTLVSENIMPNYTSDINVLFMLDFPTVVIPDASSTQNISLSPRASFFLYSESLEQTGLKLTWDDIIVGADIRYKSLCSYFEPLVKSCEAMSFKKGEFGYWESERIYPDNPELYDSSTLKIKGQNIPAEYRNSISQKIGNNANGSGEYFVKDSFNLTCKPIRHFKFPDNKVSPFMTNTSIGPFGESYIYPLGVTIDENYINIFLDVAVDNNLITQKQRDEIYGYEIYRGNLATDRTVVSSGLLYDMREYKEEEKKILYSNYPYNSYSQDKLNLDATNPTGFGTKGSQFTYHSPDSDFTGKVSGTELNVQGYQFGFSKGWFDEVKDHPKMVILGSKAFDVAGDLATIEVTAESLIAANEALASVGPLWFVAGVGSSGTNTGGYVAGVVAAALVGATILGQGILYNYARYKYQWLETFKNLGTQHNFASYYFSEGNYNYLMPIQEEQNQVRNLRVIKKLKEGRYVVTDRVDKSKSEINNIDREQSTFIKIDPITYPGQYASYDSESLTFQGENGIITSGRSAQVNKKIASPYVQVVNSNPAVHGDIDSINWLSTSYRGDLYFPQTVCLPIFGGDTFISRHTLKRKIPLFLSTLMGQANMTPFDYKFYNNIGTNPAFYVSYDVNSEFSSKNKVFPETRSVFNFDNWRETGFYIVPPSKFYLYYYGIPSFLTETRINTNFREVGREPGDNFYPEVGDIGWWTQEKIVPIRTPNYFKYNQQFSNQVNAFNTRALPASYNKRNQSIVESATNGVILSLSDNDENGQLNPWLKFKPLDFHEFESKYGTLEELKSIENESILARFAHTSILYNKVTSTVDDGTSPTTFLGGKNIFQRRTASFVNSELGYGGTQHKESLSCEFGHFYVDNKRGQVIQIPSGGGQMIEISNVNQFGKSTNMKDWFKRNLPLRILESNIEGIENFVPDNAYNFAGITMGYDSLHKRVLITKKDYLPLVDCLGYNTEDGFYATSEDCGTLPIPTCSAGYEFNPNTQLCEKVTETVLCPDGVYNEDTGMCTTTIEEVTHVVYMLEYKSNGLHSVNQTAYEHFKSLSQRGFLYKTVVTVIKYTNELHYLLRLEPGVNEDTIVEAIFAQIPMDGDEEDLMNYDIIRTTCDLEDIFRSQENPGLTQVVYSPFVGVASNRPRPCFMGQPYNVMKQRTQEVAASIGTYQQYTILKNGGDSDLIFAVPFGREDFSNSGPGIGGKNIYDLASITALDVRYRTREIEVEPCVGCNANIEEQTCVCVLTEEPTYVTESITIDNPRFFKEISWTVAYNAQLGYFSSFMDYLPNYYVNHDRYFETGKNDKYSLWAHSKTNKSFGVFYGKKYNMEVETITKASLGSYLGGVELLTEARRFWDSQDFYLNPNLTFNKSVLYNRKECSGELILDLVKGSIAKYPITESLESQRIPITQKENTYTYNYFFDRVRKDLFKPFIRNDENQIKFELDNISFKQKGQLGRLNGSYFQNRLTYNTDSRFCMVLKLNINLTNLDNQ